MLSVVLPLMAFAQGGYSLKLVLNDSQSGDAVGFATVSITKEGQEKAYKYALSTSDGKVEITGILLR